VDSGPPNWKAQVGDLAEGSKMLGFLRKILNRLENILLYLACGTTFMMMCLVTADAAGRYLFNRPIAGADEFTEKYLMVATVFFGVCYAYRGGAFIRVTFLADRLPRQAKIVLNSFIQAISILLGIMFVIATVKRAVLTFADSTTMVVIPIPLGPAYVLIPIGFFLLSLVLILDFPLIKKGGSDLFQDDRSPQSNA